MDTRNLNPVQIITLVGQLLSRQRFDELGNLARQDERVFEQLVGTMRGGQGPFCFFAATALSKVGAAAVTPLVEALHDEQIHVRQISALALGEIGDPGTVESLVERLEDASEVVRQAAAVSLGKIGAAQAVIPLLRSIGDGSELVRKAVVNALGMIGDERALPALEQVVAVDTDVVAERAQAVIWQIQEQNR